MVTFTEQAEIKSSPKKVYSIITDFGNYSKWNPWIIAADGFPEEGRLVHLKTKMGHKIMSLRHRIMTLKPDTEFRWCDVGLFTLFAYGERARFIERLENGHVSYRVDLTVTGPAQWMVKPLYGRYLEAGLKDETRALKELAEKSCQRLTRV